MPKIMCAGLIAADLVFEIAAHPAKGTKNRAKTSQLITGGGALNAASAVASLGGKASLVGAIGDDIFGAFLRQKMAERGINDQHLTVLPGVTTSRSGNMIDPDGDRTIVNHRDNALIPQGFSPPDPFPYDAVLVDTRWPEGAAMIVKAARQAGRPAVVDGEAPVAQAEEALQNASHIVFSEQGLQDYAGASDSTALATVATRLDAWCAVTRGGLPVLCHDGQTLTEVPTFRTISVNTLGAGDVWHAAFTLALAHHQTELDAVRWANAAAALKVARPIAIETLPTASEVAKLLNANGGQ